MASLSLRIPGLAWVPLLVSVLCWLPMVSSSRSDFRHPPGSNSVKKILPISKYIVGTMAGGAADCAFWMRNLTRHCNLFQLRNRFVCLRQIVACHLFVSHECVSQRADVRGSNIQAVVQFCVFVQGNGSVHGERICVVFSIISVAVSVFVSSWSSVNSAPMSIYNLVLKTSC